MQSERKPLSSVLPDAPGDHDLFNAFDSATAADDFKPLPKGTYVAVAIEGGFTEAKTGTRGYKVTFKVLEGEFANRRLWRTWHLTPAAMAHTKRDLAKFGITSGDKLRQALPPDRFVCKVTVAIRTLDDNTQTNEVKAVEVVRVQEPQPDPFAPKAEMTPQELFDSLGEPEAPGAGVKP
jgi:hypothetical protein